MKLKKECRSQEKKSRDSKLHTFLTQTTPSGMNTTLSASFFLFGVRTFQHVEMNEHKTTQLK